MTEEAGSVDSTTLRPRRLAAWQEHGGEREGWCALEAGGTALVPQEIAEAERFCFSFHGADGEVRAISSAVRGEARVPERIEPLPIAAALPRFQADPTGEVLLGLCLAADPRWIGTPGLRRAHYHGRVRLARELGVRHLMVLAPLQGYEARAHLMEPAAYVQQVLAGAIEEASITQAVEAGLGVRRLVETPGGWVALLAWANPAR